MSKAASDAMTVMVIADPDLIAQAGHGDETEFLPRVRAVQARRFIE